MPQCIQHLAVDCTPTHKLDALSDIIDTAMAEDKKIVIMARFVPELDDIQELLEKKKIGYAVVRGGVKDRDDEIHRFQYDDKCRVFVGQIAAAGLGITLTAASTMVFYSLDYSMSNFEQAKARIHRAGQKENCHYIYLGTAYGINYTIIVRQVPTGDLRQTQQTCEDICSRYFGFVQFGMRNTRAMHSYRNPIP